MRDNSSSLERQSSHGTPCSISNERNCCGVCCDSVCSVCRRIVSADGAATVDVALVPDAGEDAVCRPPGEAADGALTGIATAARTPGLAALGAEAATGGGADGGRELGA